MMRFDRPPIPSGFSLRATEASALVSKSISQGLSPEFEDSFWRSYKAQFLEAQHGKCGYCEQFTTNHPGAVEHYAPKSEIHELVEEGDEIRPLVNVRGRVVNVVSPIGYWWLAYDWDNWLVSCERCNTAWKKCLFPVLQSPRAVPPFSGNTETPLLLHPFGDIDPVEHFRFSKFGEITGVSGSTEGRETIRVCGLWRESLSIARRGTASDIYRLTNRVMSSVDVGNLHRALEAAEDIRSIGSPDRAHAGMVRSVVLEQLGISWGELLEFESGLRIEITLAEQTSSMDNSTTLNK